MLLGKFDLYFNRGYGSDPRFGLVREPGSVEVNFLGFTAIVSWAPVQSTAPSGDSIVTPLPLRRGREQNAGECSNAPVPNDPGAPFRRGVA